MSQPILFPTMTTMRYGYTPHGGSIFIIDMGEHDFRPNMEEHTTSWNWPSIDDRLIRENTCDPIQLKMHRFKYVLDMYWKYAVDEVHCTKQNQIGQCGSRFTIMHGQSNSAALCQRTTLPMCFGPSYIEDLKTAGFNGMMSTVCITSYYCNLVRQHPDYRFVFHGHRIIGQHGGVQSLEIDYIAVSTQVATSPDPRISKLTQMISNLAQKVEFLEQDNARLCNTLLVPKAMISDEEQLRREAITDEERAASHQLIVEAEKIRADCVRSCSDECHRRFAELMARLGKQSLPK